MEENKELRCESNGEGVELQESIESKMKKKRTKQARRLFASSVALIITTVIIFTAQTVAFFNDSTESGKNQIRSGFLSVKVVESTIPEGEDTAVPYPEAPIKIMPSVEVSKIVTIQNTGDLNAWISVRVDKTVASMETGELLPVDTGLFDCDFNTVDWTQKGDYWYYNKPLKAGETTKPLFTTVTFASEMDNAYANSTITFLVTANAVQSDLNGSSAQDAGWTENGQPIT